MLTCSWQALTYITGAEGFQVSSIFGDVLGQSLLLCWSFQADLPLQQPHDVLFNQTGMDLLNDRLLGKGGGNHHPSLFCLGTQQTMCAEGGKNHPGCCETPHQCLLLITQQEQPWLPTSQDWLLHILDAENFFVL